MKLTEADVQRAVVDLLQYDGWRAIRTDPVSDKSRGKGFGEIGMPDYLFVRYDELYVDAKAYLCEEPKGKAHILWIEFKRPGAKPTPAQLAWHTVERKRGALVLVVDDVDAFLSWYKSSGLMRHPVPERPMGTEIPFR